MLVGKNLSVVVRHRVVEILRVGDLLQRLRGNLHIRSVLFLAGQRRGIRQGFRLCLQVPAAQIRDAVLQLLQLVRIGHTAAQAVCRQGVVHSCRIGDSRLVLLIVVHRQRRRIRQDINGIYNRRHLLGIRLLLRNGSHKCLELGGSLLSHKRLLRLRKRLELRLRLRHIILIVQRYIRRGRQGVNRLYHRRNGRQVAKPLFRLDQFGRRCNLCLLRAA